MMTFSAALLLLSASVEAAMPAGLLVDFKRSPSLGVRLKPAFTWCATSPGMFDPPSSTAARTP